MAPSRRFPISGKNIFLTYPRCPLTKEQVLSQIHFIHLPSPSTMKFIRVSRHLLADGEPNIHLFIQLDSKVQLYTTKNFNLESPSTSALFHPNVEAFPDPEAYIDQHGDDFTDWGEFQVDRISSWGPLAEIAEFQVDDSPLF